MAPLTDDIPEARAKQATRAPVSAGPTIQIEIDKAQLTRSAGRGAIWQVVGALWQSLIQLGGSMILARLLMPADFGLLGTAMIAQVLIGRLGVLGTAAGLIAKEHPTEEDISTAFWTNLAVQGFLFAATFAAAPLLAVLVAKPEDAPGVTGVLRITCLTFLFTGAGAVSSALLRKQLRFGLLKIIESGAFLFQTLLTIVLAWSFNMGYLALVIPIAVSGLVVTIVTVLFARWWPKLIFSWSSFRFMFRFGANELGSNVVDYFQNNIDYWVIARMGMATMGLYEFSRRLPHMLLDRLAMPIGAVLFPTLARTQSSDEVLISGYLKVTRYIALVIFPLMGGLMAVADVAVPVLWGDKWLEAIAPLRVLCLRVALGSTLTCIGFVFLCKNRPDLSFKFGLMMLTGTLVAVLPLGFFFGLSGVAWGMTMSLAPGIVMLRKAFRLTNSSMTRLARTLSAPTITALASSLAALGASWLLAAAHVPPIGRLGCAVAVGGLTYLGVMWRFFPHEIRDIWQTVRTIFARKSG
jgi:O-antigen/teichoic acid export membrane protein